MKKLVLATVAVAFISLSFTPGNITRKNTIKVKSKKSAQIDFSPKLDEKRLASWD